MSSNVSDSKAVGAPQAGNRNEPPPPYEIARFSEIPGVPCPCGTARRAFADIADFPGTVHVTEISAEARVHYHKRLTETYFFLECGPDARMQLNDELIPVEPGMCVMIRPGTRHRAVGKMKVLILVLPKFDPADEWFDDDLPSEQPGGRSIHSSAPAQPAEGHNGRKRVSATPAPGAVSHEHRSDSSLESQFEAPELPAEESAGRLIRFISSGPFILSGLLAAVLLLVLALWMPQIPRQQAIQRVQAQGGTVYFEGEVPEWLYPLVGDRFNRLHDAYQIDLDNTGADDRIMPYLTTLKEASTVWLNSAAVTDAGLVHLLQFPSITSLDLGDTQVTEAGLLPLLEQHPELNTLWLQGTSAGDATLEVLGKTTSMNRLILRRTRISDEGLRHLGRLPALTSLDLDETNVGAAGMAHLSTSTTLSELSLMDTAVTDDGLAHLAKIPTLVTLYLSRTEVSDAGIEALAASTSLSTIYLDETKVSDAALPHIAAMTSLSTVSLTSTAITDEGLEHLHSARHLSEINLNGTQVTSEGISRLRAALPDCSVDDSGFGGMMISP